jgi:hypothetical protein
MSDHGNDNAFDLNLGAGLGPAYGANHSIDYSVSAFTSVNHPAATPSTTRTVSPRDIFQDPLASAPPSAAFTNLTSPDMNSPFITDDLDASPLFQTDDAHSWYSLFPDPLDGQAIPTSSSVAATVGDSAQTIVGMQRSVSNNSFDLSSSSTNSPIILDNSHRRKSSVTDSPSAGVSKPRRRKGPLPPIAVNPQDKAAMKRARNTLAARDSRQRKFDHINKLEGENSELKDRITELETEAAKWKAIALGLGYTGSA